MWIKEDFLHFIWKFQKFNHKQLQTTDGRNVAVYDQGQHNHGGGPDFEEARLAIDEIQWCGHVEIHVKASDWYRHGHQHDLKYDNVILHVVWKADTPVNYPSQDSMPIPTVEIQPLVPLATVEACRQLMSGPSTLACSGRFEQVHRMKKVTTLDRMVVRRLQRKAQAVSDLLKWYNGDWQQTIFAWMTQQYGFKLNKHAMEQVGVNVAVKALLKHRESLLQLEALLLGVAGLIRVRDEYSAQLQKEFDFLKVKYQLDNRIMARSQWKFMRTRPANFPPVRLAQLAALIYFSPDILYELLSIKDTKALLRQLKTPVSAYWQEHYDFGKKSKKKQKGMGNASAELLIINGIAPLLAAYGSERGSEEPLQLAMSHLEKLPAEKNQLIRKWEEHAFTPESSLDSQGMIEWYNEFCQPRKCLECSVGAEIVHGAKTE